MPGTEDLVHLIIRGEVSEVEIKAKSVACNQDPLVYLMTDCYDFARVRSNEQLEKFIEQIEEFTKILLKQSQSAKETGDGSKYQWRVYINENNIEMSLLHIAAERNLDGIAEILVDEYPNLLYLKTDCSGSEDAPDQGKMPIELALGSEKNIDVSAFLIGRMSEERFNQLFENGGNDNLRLSLLDYIDKYLPHEEQSYARSVFADFGPAKHMKKIFGKRKECAKKLKEKKLSQHKRAVEKLESVSSLRKGIIIHTDQNQWSTVKALKDLVCSGEQEFCHILDVRRNFKGENFEEKLKQCLATCTSLLLIWSPSVRDYINENKPVSVPIGSTKETVCFSSAILTDFQNRTVKIVPESLLPEDNDQEDGYNNIVQLELQQGQKVSHRILQDKSIPKKVSDALNRIHCREAFTRSKSLVDS